MGDEYQLRRDIDKLYDKTYDFENKTWDIYTKEEIAENYYDKGQVDELVSQGGGGGGDLSNYYTKTEIDGILSSYATIGYANSRYALINHTHSQYVRREELHNLDIDLTTIELVDYETNPNGVICFDDLGGKYIEKSNTSGLVKNDGTIDTTQYLSSLPSHNHDDRYYTESEVDSALTGKQATLVSGTNIKTVNNESLLGSGNITISSSSKNVFYGTCSTSASTQTKVVTCDDWRGNVGDIIFVKFTNGNSYDGTAKLKIGSDTQEIATVGSTMTSRYYWKSGEVVGFVLDGSNMVLLEGGTATTTYYGITKLSDSISSTSTSLSATANAVRKAYNLANGKQDELVSGTNIKTVNNVSLLGSGDIDVLDLIDVDIDMDLMDNGYLKMEANLIERSNE